MGADTPDLRASSAAARPVRVLIADGDAELRRSLAKMLLSQGFDVLSAADADAARTMLQTAKVDVLLLDLAMQDRAGGAPSKLSKALRGSHPGLLILGLSKLDAPAVQGALPAGVFALIAKPILAEALVLPLIRRALDHRALERRTTDLAERVAQHEAWGAVVGRSKSMAQAMKLSAAVAQGSAHVWIEGEPGTGKELFARLIHRQSRRADRQLIMLRCGAMPEDLLEVTLFGEAGALLAAMPGQAGMWAAAEQGTLLLDEATALPPELQGRLFHALSGGTDEGAAGRRRDVRVIATSSSGQSGGAFRDDLRMRLSGARIVLPPLRQRKDDIVLLAYHFARRAALLNGRSVRRISIEALRTLRSHAWPGNVRELKDAVEHAVLTAQSDVIFPADLPPLGEAAAPAPEGRAPVLNAISLELPYAVAKEKALHDFERAYVEALLAQTDENVSEAARRAGMDRSNFRRLLKRAREGAAKNSKG